MPAKKISFKHNDEQLKKALKSIQAYDLSVRFKEWSEHEQKRIIKLIEHSKLCDMFVELGEDEQLILLKLLSITEQKTLLKTLQTDDLKGFIEEIEDEKVKQDIILLLPPVKAKTIKYLLTYDEDLAASIMTTDYVTAHIHESIKALTNRIVTSSKEQDYIDTIFIVDDDMAFLGSVDLKDLIIARATDTLEDILDEDETYVYEDESIEKAIQTVKDYDRNAIPVVNHKHEILGIITADDIFDEVIESHEDDYQKMALLQDYESSSSSFKRSKQRLPWLMIAVVLNLFIAIFLSIFEATLAQVTAIVLFQPLVLGMAGNIGTQSLAVTILGLHLEELDNKKLPKEHVFRETMVGFLNSLTLGVSAFLMVFIFLSIIPTGAQNAIEMAFVVSLAVFSSMFISAVMGVLIPLTLERLHIDPATASGPIITSINDLVALMIYFGIATIAFMI
jgi:magnesium transporter